MSIPKLCPVPATLIPLEFCPNCKPVGVLTVNKGDVVKSLVPKIVPSSKITLSAVLPKKEPPICIRAFAPKLIPLGLIKIKLALPLACNSPSILEIELPVTRPTIFSISPALLKYAVLPVGTENS